MHDRSLDEFLSDATAGTDAGDGASDAGPVDEPATAPLTEGGDDAADLDSTGETADEPAVSTYRVPAEPTPCRDCGDSVRALWRDDDTFVCADCKTW